MANLPKEDRVAKRGRGRGRVNLTKRELEILPFLKGSLCFKEIAQRLRISARTAKWHAGEIYRKFGVADRLELIEKLDVSDMPLQAIDRRLTELEYRFNLIADVITSGIRRDFRRLG